MDFSNISASSIIASIFFSIIGWFVFKIAKTKSNVTVAFMGIFLMFYTYFTPNAWVDWLLGFALTGLSIFLLQKA